jgi:hypothetical protein
LQVLLVLFGFGMPFNFETGFAVLDGLVFRSFWLPFHAFHSWAGLAVQLQPIVYFLIKQPNNFSGNLKVIQLKNSSSRDDLFLCVSAFLR